MYQAGRSDAWQGIHGYTVPDPPRTHRDRTGRANRVRHANGWAPGSCPRPAFQYGVVLWGRVFW